MDKSSAERPALLSKLKSLVCSKNRLRAVCCDAKISVSRTRDWNEDERLVSSQLSAAGPRRPSYMCPIVI